MRGAMGHGVTLWAASIWLLSCSACAPSDEEVQADFDAFIAEHDRCELNSECVQISPGCPLGCAVAVRADSAGAAQALAAELIDDYQSLGRSCQYDCVPVEGVSCSQGRCAICTLTGAGAIECMPNR